MLDLENLRMEDVNGERHVEREYTAYVQVADFNWIDDAKEQETHEQWKINFGEDSKVTGRLRLINNRRYTIGIKQPLRGEDGWYECEQDLSPDMFEMMKLACTQGYLKERFNFPIEGTDLKWEVDVFKSRAGGRSNWVKVDLEYHSKNDPIPDFPITIVGEPIIVDKVMTMEKEDFIDSLWETEWLRLEHGSARGKQ